MLNKYGSQQHKTHEVSHEWQRWLRAARLVRRVATVRQMIHSPISLSCVTLCLSICGLAISLLLFLGHALPFFLVQHQPNDWLVSLHLHYSNKFPLYPAPVSATTTNSKTSSIHKSQVYCYRLFHRLFVVTVFLLWLFSGHQLAVGNCTTIIIIIFRVHCHRNESITNEKIAL